MFLPLYDTPLLQPMDQNVVHMVKVQNKQSVLYKVLSKNDCVSMIHLLKERNIKGMVFSLGNAWENLYEKTIICSWGNLWPDMALLEQKKRRTEKIMSKIWKQRYF